MRNFNETIRRADIARSVVTVVDAKNDVLNEMRNKLRSERIKSTRGGFLPTKNGDSGVMDKYRL